MPKKTKEPRLTRVTLRFTDAEAARLREEAATRFPRESEEEEGFLSKVVLLALDEHWGAAIRTTPEHQVGLTLKRFPAAVRRILLKLGDEMLPLLESGAHGTRSTAGSTPRTRRKRSTTGRRHRADDSGTE